jgi:hypothetical protein
VPEPGLAQVAQGLEEHAGWERPLWQRHEKVRWQAWGRGERSWGENETVAKEERFLAFVHTCADSILERLTGIMVDINC